LNLGFSELLMIFLVALIAFGPDKLPELARIIGRSLREVRKASAELQYTVRETFEQLEDGRASETSIRDLYQKLDPRAMIQEAIKRPFSEPLPDHLPGTPPASTEGLGISAEEPYHEALSIVDEGTPGKSPIGTASVEAVQSSGPASVREEHIGGVGPAPAREGDVSRVAPDPPKPV
jgi:Tat protein translocase TatB subunit